MRKRGRHALRRILTQQQAHPIKASHGSLENQILLVREIQVDCSLAHACLPGDLIEGDLVDPVGAEQLLRRLHDPLFLVRLHQI
jgi:hypothetical protein